jgi:hypothetical protein
MSSTGVRSSSGGVELWLLIFPDAVDARTRWGTCPAFGSTAEESKSSFIPCGYPTFRSLFREKGQENSYHPANEHMYPVQR